MTGGPADPEPGSRPGPPSDLLGPVGDGGTTVHPDLTDHLIPTWIATLADLYEVEEAAIAAATFRRRPRPDQLLDDLYLRNLHRAMFGEVWRWAGRYRTHDVNIGAVPWPEVPALVRDLVADARAWVEAATYPADEVAVRFHHRLVQIHPFVNGNGRLSRFAADYLVVGLGQPRFTWGAGLAVGREELRARYRAALQDLDADRGAVGRLLGFCRS